MRCSAIVRDGLTNARAFQIFQVLRQGGMILIAIALAKGPLAVAEVGNYEMLTYLGYLLTFFWVSGLMQGLLSQYPTLTQDRRRTLLFQAFALFTLIAVLVGGGAWLGRKTLLPLLVQRESLPYLGLFVIFLGANLTASLQEHFYLLTERKLTLVVYGGISMLAQVVAVALPPWLGFDFYYSFVGLAAVGVLKWLWLFGYVVQRGRWQWSTDLLGDWWRISWPLGLYALVGGLNQALGPWLVGYFFEGDTERFALYRYGARELPLLAALAGALGSAMIPALAGRWEAGLRELRAETVKLYHILFPITLGLMLTAHWWFPWVFSEEFAESVPLFRTFLLTTPAHLIFARTLLVARRDTRWIPAFALLGFVLQLTLGLLFVPQFGLLGVAWATVISFAVEKLLLLLYAQRKYTISWREYTPWKWWVLYTGCLVVSYALLV